MKTRFAKLNIALVMSLVVILLLSGCRVLAPLQDAHKTVLCVGDSITKGVGVADEKNDAYPAVLAKRLGAEYTVLNFGVNGTTVADVEQSYYNNTRYYDMSLNTSADILVLMLGTNDCMASTWNANAFKKAYKKLIKSYQKANDHIEIILVLPIPIYLEGLDYSNDILINEVVPIISAIADDYHLKTVDAYGAFKGDLTLYNDSVHPNEKGAMLLADLVNKAIQQ